jgi:hypothetical protein
LFFFATFFLSFHFEFGSVLIEFHELGKIELGFLEKLDLSNMDILEREDFSTFLLDLFTYWLSDAKDIINIYCLEKSKDLQFLGKLLEGGFLSLIDHNFHHLFTNSLDLWWLGIAGGSDLLWCSLCEANSKQS